MIRDKTPPGIFLTGIQFKVMRELTDEYQPTETISIACGYARPQSCTNQLMALHELGLVESRWDGDLGKRYWRKKQS